MSKRRTPLVILDRGIALTTKVLFSYIRRSALRSYRGSKYRLILPQ